VRVDIEPLRERVDLVPLSEGVDIEPLRERVDLVPLRERVDLDLINENAQNEAISERVQSEPYLFESTEDFESVGGSSENVFYDENDENSFSDFSSTSSETNFEDLEDFYTNNDYFEKEIYLNSEIKFKHFISVFVSLFGDLQIPDTSLDKLLKFIRAIVPQEKLNIPKTYKSLKSTFYLPKVVTKRICGKFSDGLIDGAECPQLVCQRFKNTKKNKGKKDPILTEFNFVPELKLLLAKNWPLLMEYKTKLDSNEVTDICNSNLYKSSDVVLNQRCLILRIR
jgi:hypothetical protein